MNPDFVRHSPLRSPQWRFERVLHLVRHRPQALKVRWADDHSIRAYRNLLLKMAAARRNEAERDAILTQYADLAPAHAIYYSPDQELRQQLEALLLTEESFADIAVRLGTTEKTIEYFEELFFNVRDRLSNQLWIQKVIRGGFDPVRSVSDSDLASAQRGYLLRLFAHCGGILALDVMIRGFDPHGVPRRPEEVRAWFADVLEQLVRTGAVTAASALPLTQGNALRLIQLALKNRGAEPAGNQAGVEFEQTVEKILSSIRVGYLPRDIGQLNQAQQEFAVSAVEPRLEEQLNLSEGSVPLSLADAARYAAAENRLDTRP